MAPSKSLLVKLHLMPSNLKKFTSSSSSSGSSPAASIEPSQTAADSSPSTTVGTPAASSSTNNNGTANPLLASQPIKRKGIPGPKPGSKRSAATADAGSATPASAATATAAAAPANGSTPEQNGAPKPRGKPGPKKRMRIDAVNGTAVPVSAPKINPKASTGAINANLRALDRTGKPCRRWNKAVFSVKSFTGVNWAAPAWSAPQKKAVTNGDSFEGDVKSDSSETGSGKVGMMEQAGGSSAVMSEKGSSGGEVGTPLGMIVEEASSASVTVVAAES